MIIPTDKQFIYQYVNNNNEWIQFCRYPNKLELSGHSMCFDKNKQKLIIYDGKGKKINIKTKDHCLCFLFNNTIHLIGGFRNNKHFISTNDGNSFEEISKFDSIKNGIIGHSIIKLEKENKLLMLGGWDYYDNSNNNNNKQNGTLFNTIYEYDGLTKKWTKLEHTKMPHKMCGFGYVLSDDERFIVIFGGQKQGNKQYLNEIFYLNLNNMEWTKSSIKCPKKSGYHSIITKQGDIHLFERVPNWKYG